VNGWSPPPQAVGSSEVLARFILHDSYIRENGTIRPNAFIPYPYPDLSITRHIGLSDRLIWEIGDRIAQQCSKNLHGRGDVPAHVFLERKLTVVPDDPPDPTNPNHANVRGWPGDKAGQKMLAQEISAKATYAPKPGGPNLP
jgi:hypothetical protein